MKAITTAIFLMFLLLASHRASAGEWDTVGAACRVLPDYQALSDSQTGDGTLGIKSSSTGLLYAVCPIQYPNGINPTQMWVLLKDTSSAPSDFVNVDYYKIDKTTGVVSHIAQVLTGSSCVASYGSTYNCTTSFSDTFLPSSYVYFVQIELNKVSASAVEQVQSITLF